MPARIVTLGVVAVTDKANRDIAATGAYFQKLREANPVELKIKFDRLQAIAESKILAREMSQTVRDTVKLDVDRGFGGGLGGLLTRGLFGGGAIALPGAGLTAAIAGLPLLTSGILGIIPALVAAGAGVAAFGALAIPTFMTVTGAVTTISAATKAVDAATTVAGRNTALAKLKADWAALTPVQASLVRGVQALQASFSAMADKLAPDVLRIFNEGLKIANTLLPALLPFAQAAAGAILTLLQNFEKFAASPGFRAFQAEMLRLTGPTILAIGTGIGQIAVALGKLLLALTSSSALRDLRVFFEVLAGAVTGLAAFFAWATPRFNNSLREVETWARVLTRLFTSTIPLAFDIFKESARVAFDEIEITALNFVFNLTGIMGHLPGFLGAPFRAAHKIIGGEMAGIQADVANGVANIQSDFAKLNGTSANLFVYTNFVNVGTPPSGIFPTPSGGPPGTTVVPGRRAAAFIPGPGPAARGPASVNVTLMVQSPGPQGSLDQAFTTWLQKSVVVRGGGSVQAAWGSGTG